MPVNWSLLNPSLPATAQTINPFAALNAGRAQAEERIQNQQASELRGLQIDSARAGLESQKTAGQAAALATQAWQLRESDPAKAAEILQQGMALNPSAFSETTKQLVQQARDEAATASSRETALSTEQKRTAPFMLQAVQMAKGGDVEGARELLRSAGIYDPQHEQFLTNPKVLPAFEATLRPLVPIDQRTEMTAVQRATADAAARRAAAAERAAAAAERRAAQTPPPTPTTPEADRDIERYNRIVALGDKASPGEIAWRKKYEKSAGGGEMGAREAAYFDRVVNGASLGIAALNNIAQLPTTANAGPLGIGSSPGPSIFQSGLDTLRNTLSNEEVQNYNTYVAGLVNNLAIIESSGLAPNAGFVHQFDRIMFREGDSKTGLVALGKMAEARQIIIRGLEPKLRNPRIPQEQKDLIRDLIAEVKQIIPYSQEDLIRFRAAQQKNPKLTIEQWGRQIPTAERRGTPAAPLNLGRGITVPGVGTSTPAPARPAAPASGGWGIQRIE